MTMSVTRRLAALALAGVFAAGACTAGASSPSSPAGSGSASQPAVSNEPAGPTPPECLSFADIYALVGPESDQVANWSDAATIAGELGSSTEFPEGLPIAITAPGEESGTFDSFVELVLADFIEERAQPEGATTRLTQYTSSSNDTAIIEGIANTGGSFGWVGFAFYEENLDRVRAFSIAAEADGDCIAPTASTIADTTYPISRDLFIYVNKAKAAENPAVVAYVDFYMADGTIDGVLETVPYVPLGDALADTQAAWETEKPGTAGDPNGTIFVTGSSTVQPISNGVAEAFKATNAGFSYTVEGPGTGDGFAKFCTGGADIADASRPIREEEAAECAAAGIEFVELKVAIDGIAVLTRK